MRELAGETIRRFRSAD